MSHQPGQPLSDDEIRRYHQLRQQVGHGSTPAGVRPILFAVLATLLWLVLVAPLTSGTGQTLTDRATREGSATVAECSRKWQSFGQTWGCDAQVTWTDGSTQPTHITSPDDVSGQEVAVVIRHSEGRFNTNSGTRNTGAAHVVTADHPHDSQWWNNIWVLSLAGVLVVWVVAGMAISRGSRRIRGSRR